jgi:hypothetical protein
MGAVEFEINALSDVAMDLARLMASVVENQAHLLPASVIYLMCTNEHGHDLMKLNFGSCYSSV